MGKDCSMLDRDPPEILDPADLDNLCFRTLRNWCAKLDLQIGNRDENHATLYKYFEAELKAKAGKDSSKSSKESSQAEASKTWPYSRSTSNASTASSSESQSQSQSQSQSRATPGEGWTNSQLPLLMRPYLQSNQIHLFHSHRRYIHTAHGWSRTGNADPNDAIASSSAGTKLSHESTDKEIQTVKCLMSQLCESFYKKGWMPGTGGGMSIRIGDGSDSSPFRVFSTPSGIMKEDMVGEDIFELDMRMNVTSPPLTPNLKLSSMTNLWFCVYEHHKDAMCVIHTHSISAQLATLLDPTESADCLQITHLEMIKGVGNHAYDSILQIPIIDNQPSEHLLAPDLEKAMQEYPKCNAVLVRRHGVYVWGSSWEEAKVRLESFDYLFESAIKMKSMGIDPGVVPGKKIEKEVPNANGDGKVNGDNNHDHGNEETEKATILNNKRKRTET